MIKGIIFDMDGLILDTEKYYFKCWTESAEEFGFHLKPRHALAIRSLSAVYAERYLKKALGEDFDYHAVRARRRELVQAEIDKKGIEVKPGAKELLEYCREKHILTAVATATPTEKAVQHLKNAGLVDLFSMVIGGDSIERGKPAPDIYIKAAAALKLDASDCLALEDSPNGIISAFSAGCKPVMIPDLTEPEEMLKPLLYEWVPALSEVIDILKMEKGE
ncbi:MAG: HAD family hydrolase [Ruminococcus sp.]